ncbi:Uroporphyrinogen decarboxylase 1 [Arachis hypogaea]|nr:Uroporphyrinogen decarboxylase 1 [Arachis hypogaea]
MKKGRKGRRARRCYALPACRRRSVEQPPSSREPEGVETEKSARERGEVATIVEDSITAAEGFTQREKHDEGGGGCVCCCQAVTGGVGFAVAIELCAAVGVWIATLFLLQLATVLASVEGSLCYSSKAPFSPKPHFSVTCSASSSDPLLVKAARGEPVSRPSAWMMRQAGRYMAVYRKLAEKYPSFRERSKTTDLIVEISLQPWNAFRPDGVIIFSDIRTPRPAFGVEFDIEDVRGPVIQSPIRSKEGLKALHPIDLEKLSFIGDSLKILRKEGVQHAPIQPLRVCAIQHHIYCGLCSLIWRNLGLTAYKYLIHERWSNPYIKEIVDLVKKRCPETPIVLYINGNGGLLERMKDTGVDVIGLDWTVDMADRRSDLRFFLVLYVEQLPLKPRESTQAKLPHQLC